MEIFEEIQTIKQKEMTEHKPIIDIDRVIFKDVSDNELNVVNAIKSKNATKKYFKKMSLSIFVILILFAMQSAGDVFKKYSIEQVSDNKGIIFNAFSKYIILMVAVFIIFNTVSLFIIFVRRQLVSLTENYYILLEAKVADKYSGKKLVNDGKNRKKHYIIFECDQGVCSKAIEADKALFNRTAVGDKIVVLKAVTVDGVILKYLGEDEYRSFYNARVKNS